MKRHEGAQKLSCLNVPCQRSQASRVELSMQFTGNVITSCATTFFGGTPK